MDDFDALLHKTTELGVISDVSVDEITDAVARGGCTESEAASKLRGLLRQASDEAKLCGNALFKTSDFEAAVEKYKLATRIDGSNSTAWSNAALCLLKLGKADFAAETAHKAVLQLWETDPDNDDASDPSKDPIALKALHRRGLANEAKGGVELLERALVDLATADAAGAKVGADLQRVRTRLQELVVGEEARDDNLLGEVVDIKDKRLRQLRGEAFDITDLPKCEHGPFAEMGREVQKGHLNEMLLRGMDAVDKAQAREAIEAARTAVMLSVMLGDAPSTLMAFTVLSSAHVLLRNFKVAYEYGRRATSILKPFFPFGDLSPDDKVAGPQSGAMMIGLSHPRSSYSPRTVLVCEAFTYLAIGRVYSGAMKMADAIHAYRRCEQALRCLPGDMARNMLATTLGNIGNNFSKNQNLTQAEEAYAQMRAIRAGLRPNAEDGLHAVADRSSQALLLHKQGKDEEAIAQLTDVWHSSDWQADWIAQKMQVALLLTNLSPPADQASWLSHFRELSDSLGKELGDSCCVCLEPFAPRGTAADKKIYITTCHHVLHVDCWESHKSSVPAGQPVCCPECRHEIVVSTAPTMVTPTGEAVPLRPGHERADFAQAMSSDAPGMPRPVLYMPRAADAP